MRDEIGNEIARQIENIVKGLGKSFPRKDYGMEDGSNYTWRVIKRDKIFGIRTTYKITLEETIEGIEEITASPPKRK